ncbi:hypothetical protein COV93_00480 [Candidatus Woesearchaeota archaeon CG11_big_fil_rev_8_21_14_0_20_43_8]|nr:MAG: hypothetical protein COV93_00480 [Candidatus Woesearchaeota archaeon CG11_big_fil_rev_8_21_14_0_20_43_8]PIO04904.1 MAG: hypothetical protein COT47_07015 [Candidatus Woesearchaeota archaeon CG08_land_8_20_14_0_20_43_7]
MGEDDNDFLYKIVKGVRKAYNVLAYPSKAKKKAKRELDKHRDTDMAPIERDIKMWKDVKSALENAVIAYELADQEKYMLSIPGYLKDCNDSYKMELDKLVDSYKTDKLDSMKNQIKADFKRKSGKTLDKEIEFNDVIRPNIDYLAKMIEFKEERKDEVEKKGPGKAKYYGWTAADGAIKGGITVLVVRALIKKFL